MEIASIERDASCISWCPVGSAAPFTLSSGAQCEPKYLLATAHQEIDSSFNSKSAIEILSASPSLGEPRTISSLGNCASRLPLSTLSWGQQTAPTASCPLGLIAGGMEDGTITLWNPYKLITSNTKQALLGEYGKYHQHKITAMQFNPTVAQHTFLATADAAEKLFVWDLTAPSRPLAQQPPGGPSSSAGSGYPQYATCVAWNHNVSYILAVSSCLGQTRIYDLRHKKVALTFESKQRGMDKAVALSWSPLKARQLAVCYASGEAEVWDLKQPKSPKLRLPTQNVLDLSWSTLDKNLLLTAHQGAIGRLWNGNSAALMSEFEFESVDDKDGPQQIEWNNERGGLVAALSTQKISIHEMMDCGESYVPKWLRRESGAAHAFGGRLVSFGTVKEAASENSKSKKEKVVVLPPRLTVETMPKSQAMMARAMQFRRTLKSLENANELRDFCDAKRKSLESVLESKNRGSNGSSLKPKVTKKEKKAADDILADLGISDSDEEEEVMEEEIIIEAPVGDGEGVDVQSVEREIAVWSMIGLFFDGDNYKDDLVRFLGFEKQEMIGLVEQEKAKLSLAKSESKTHEMAEEVQPSPPVIVQQPEESSDDDGSDFFNALIDDAPSPRETEQKTANSNGHQEKEKERDQKEESSVDQPVRAQQPQQRIRTHATAEDEAVRHAVITGNYEFAIDCALKHNQMADALLFAHYAQDTLLWEMVSRRYLDTHSNAFMADTFGFVAKKEFAELVAASAEHEWRQTLAILLSFTDNDELKSLCNALGQRLAAMNIIDGAVSCFLCSQNVAELVTLWTNPTPSTGIQGTAQPKKEDVVLHSAITKALVFVKALEGRGEEQSGQAALSSVFCRYANLLANAGSTETALSFLEFVAQLQQGGRADQQIGELRDRITGQCRNAEPYHQQSRDPRNVRNAEPVKQPRRRSTDTRPTRPGTGPRVQNPPQNNLPGQQRPRQESMRPTRPGPPSRQPVRRPPKPQPQPVRQPVRQQPVRQQPVRQPVRQQPVRQPVRQQPVRQPVRQQQQDPSQRQQYGNADPTPVQTMPSRGPSRRGRMRGPPGPGRANTQGNSQTMSPRGNPAPGPGPNTQTQPPRRRAPTSSSMPLSPRGPRRSSQPQPMTQPQTPQPMRGNQGMNGAAPTMPSRNNRRGRGGGRVGAPGPVRSNRKPMMPPTTQPLQQPHQQAQPQRQPQQQPQIQPQPTLPARSRGRGRQRAMPGGSPQRAGPVRGPAPMTQPAPRTPRRRSNPNQQQRNEYAQQPQPIEQVQAPAAAVQGYHPAAVSSGTGFFGQTALLDDDADAPPLPSDAAQSVESMKQWLDELAQSEQASAAVRKKLAMQSVKMGKDVAALLGAGRLSSYAFSTMTGIVEALQTQSYDHGLKLITDFTKSCKNKKREKFATHRKWVMALQAILRIAKQQGL